MCLNANKNISITPQLGGSGASGLPASGVPTDESGTASAFAATWDCVCKNGISGKTCTEDQIDPIFQK